MVRLSILLMLSVFSAGTCSGQDISKRRQWKSKDGKFAVVASYKTIDFASGSVVLDTGEKEIKAPLSKLDERSISLLNDWFMDRPSKLASTVESQSKKIAELQGKVGSLEQSNNALKIKNLELQKLVPSNGIANDDGIPVVTQNTLEIKGNSMQGKEVKLSYSSFQDIDQALIRGWGTTYVGFYSLDANYESVKFVAQRSKFGDFLASVKRGDRLNIQGKITAVHGAGVSWVIEVTAIEKSAGQ